MGIVNITPDSFSDGGLYWDSDAALERITTLVAEGASVIDLGAESTRPGSQPVSAREQLKRLMPVLERIDHLSVPLSIDTSEPEVIRTVADHPAVGAINDIRALSVPGALEAVANSNLGVCLMHMQGTPQTMQQQPHYHDPVHEVTHFLLERAWVCRQAGLEAARICIDPGFGFGKTFEHNAILFQQIHHFAHLGYPLLVGVSRKRMLAHILESNQADRTLAGSLAAALAYSKGAHILRVHDLTPTIQAIAVMRALG